MHIIEHDWAWAHGLSQRTRTDAIVLHHAAAKTASPEQVHAWHLQNGWAGIGYHLYIRKDGSVHAGRPIWASGAHTMDHNHHTVGVCCEGDYETETAMPPAQLRALKAAIRYLHTLYPDAALQLHRDFNATACPGRHFPTEEVFRFDQPETAEQEETMKRYRTVDELPDWAQAGIRALLDQGVLEGKGGEAGLDLTEDMARVLIICARMEGIA